jgi:kynurenine formamidase
MDIRLTVAGATLRADLSDPLPLAIPLDFDGPQPSHFGAPRASARVLDAPGFHGDTRAGGSVNCETLSLVPHCNGTHTECLGHVTEDRVAVHDVLKGGLFVAVLVTIDPCAAQQTTESSQPRPLAADRLVTAAALSRSLSHALPRDAPAPAALVVRTLPNDAGKLTRRYEGAAPAAYFTREAAEWLVERGVLHLVTDLPSIDRAEDGGHLTAHRTFFGLPPGGRRASDARRAGATVTELAWIAPTIGDGLYLLDLQLPAFLSDAAPCRPLLYRASLA